MYKTTVYTLVNATLHIKNSKYMHQKRVILSSMTLPTTTVMAKSLETSNKYFISITFTQILQTNTLVTMFN